MPSTYPASKHLNNGYQHHNQIPSPLRTPPTPSTPATASSRFLSPVQDARIRSWRNHTSSDTTPTPVMPDARHGKSSKSAPATLAHESSSSGARSKCSSMEHSPTCSCARSQKARPQHPHSRERSYYSSRKKVSTTTGFTSETPSPVHRSPMIQPSPEQMAAYQTQSGGQMQPSPEQMAAYQAQSGGQMQPSPEQMAAYQAQSGLQNQPQPQVMPAAPVSDPPRIAGARDPITQNYWRGRFPPVGGPLGINNGVNFSPFGPGMMPGTYPPQAFGMGMGGMGMGPGMGMGMGAGPW